MMGSLFRLVAHQPRLAVPSAQPLDSTPTPRDLLMSAIASDLPWLDHTMLTTVRELTKFLRKNQSPPLSSPPA